MSKLTDYLNKYGRLPKVKLMIRPIESARPAIVLDQYLSYDFQSSILIPVDSFSFTFSQPQSGDSLLDIVKEGDIAVLIAGDQTIFTGIIDMVDIETTKEGGDVVKVMGRDLMGQLEDSSCVSTTDDPIYLSNSSIAKTVRSLLANTRIKGLSRTQNAPTGPYLFATEPGESKLSALQRFLEPLNCLAWMDPNGYVVIGRPNMGAKAKGKLVMDRNSRFSNVTSMKATYNATQIPNIIIPIWTGQENVQKRVAKEQRVLNNALAPNRLRKQNHLVQRAVIVSTPQGSDPQSLSGVNDIKVAGANLLQAHALRELARENVKELIVQASVQGHYNDVLEPFLPDQCYDIFYPRAGVDRKMYLMAVDYQGSQSGARTTLTFCKTNRIVAGGSVAEVTKEIVKRGNLG